MSARDPQAQLIADAARQVREIALSANPDLWAAAYAAVRRSQDADPDAALIGLMSPAVALAAADFLDSILDAHDQHSTGLTWTHEMPARALAIAAALRGVPVPTS